MKKLLYSLIIAIILCTALAVTSFAATVVKSGSCGDNVTYTLDSDGVLTISGTGDMTDYYSATDIPWYSNRPNIKSIVINNGITRIGHDAFRYCINLTSVTIGEGVASIGGSAFSYCENLTTVIIPNSVITIEMYAFDSCKALQSVTMGSGVKNIEDSAFKDCSNLISLIIPDNVANIGSYAFRDCINLTSVSLGSGIKTIGDSAFYYCDNLIVVYNNSSITLTMGNQNNGEVACNAYILFDNKGSISTRDGYHINENKFVFDSSDRLVSYVGNNNPVTLPKDFNGNEYSIYHMKGVRDVIIPDGITTVSGYAFYECSTLTSVTIPDSVTSIGSWAFYDCDSLTSVTIPDGLTSIGYGAFENCTSLTSVTIPDSVTSIDSWAFNGCGSLTSVTIPDSVTSIGDYAFAYCSSSLKLYGYTGSYAETYAKNNGITFVALAKIITSGSCGENIEYTLTTDGVLTISGSGAMTDYSSYTSTPWYSNQSSIKTVVIKNGVTSIGSSAFEYCTGLTSVTIGDSVTSIGRYAFYECSSLTSVTIPDSVTSIGYNAFYNTAYYNNSSNWENGLLYIGNCLIDAQRSISGLCTIKNGTRFIAEYALDYCSKLSSVIIPDGVTNIGSYAFESCTALTSVVIGNDVTSIGDGAFSTCSSLTGITIPESVTSIGNVAFSSCSKLKEICVDENNENYSSDENGILYSKDKTTLICCPAGTELTKLTIPDSVISIEYGGFRNCTSLTNVIVGNGVISIGAHAFRNCSKLISVTLGNSITNISDSTFRNCKKLTSVIIPDSVTSISVNAFYYCTSLASVIIPDSVTSIAPGVFDSCSDGFTIYGYEGSYAETYAKERGIAFETMMNEPENVAEGTIGTLNWVITSDGILTVAGEGAIPDYTRSATAPWTTYAKQITSIVVGDGVTSIGNYAFYNLTKATSITIADSVKYLGLQFIRGTAIAELYVNAETIAANAFGRADSLKTLSMGEGFKNALGNIFYSETLTVKAPENSYAYKYVEYYDEKYPSSQASITLEADGVATTPVARFGSMGDNAFYAMYENAKGNWKMVVSGTGAMKNFPYYSTKNEKKGYTFCPTHYMSLEGVETKIYAIEVLEGITTVGNYAFYKCTKASSVSLPDGITSIGQGAFRTCAKLVSVTLPEAVTKIEANAFNGCTNLTSINIPNGVTTIGADIFVKCNTSALTVITAGEKMIDYISKNYPEITVK